MALDNDASSKSKRGKTTLIVVMLIAIGVAIPVYNEYQVKRSYEATVASLRELVYSNATREKLSFRMAERLLEGSPTRLTKHRDGSRHELYEWRGIKLHYMMAMKVVRDPKTGAENVMTVEVHPDDIERALARNENPKPQDDSAGVAQLKKTVYSAEEFLAKPDTKNAINPDGFRVVRAIKETAWRRFPKIHPESDQTPSEQIKRRLLAKSTIEPFKEYGAHNPVWNDLVSEFFTLYIEGLTPNYKTKRRLVQNLVHPVLESGCDDPLVLAVIASQLWKNGENALALRTIHRSQRADWAKYPKRFRLAAYILSLKLVADIGEASEVVRLKQRTLQLLPSAFQDVELDDDSRRLHYSQISELINSFYSRGKEIAEFVTVVMNISKMDEWLRKMTLAHGHRNYAWKTRPNARMQTGGPFGIRMGLAHKQSTEAWNIHPHLPEAATLALDSTNGWNFEFGAEFWFEQVMRYECTNVEAFGTNVRRLLPRFQGSVEELLAFGNDCIDTGKFETNVPWVYHFCIGQLAKSGHDRATVMRIPGVFESYVRLIEGYQEFEGGKRDAFRKTQLACVAFLAGRPNDAAARLAELGDKVDPTAFSDFQAHRSIVEIGLKPPSTDAGGGIQKEDAAVMGLMVDKTGALVVGSGGNTRVWDFASATELGRLVEGQSEITIIAASKDKQFIATGEKSGRVVVWNARLRKDLQTVQIVGPVNCIEFLPSGHHIATGGGDGHIRVWDLDDGRLTATFPSRETEVLSLSVSKTTGLLAAKHRFENRHPGWQTAAFWDPNTGEMKRQVNMMMQTLAVEYSHDAQWLLALGFGAGWNKLKLYGKDKLVSLETPAGRIAGAIFSNDDKTVFVAIDTAIHAFDRETQALVATYRGHQNRVTALTTSNDGHYLISGDQNGQIRQWDIRTIRSTNAIPLLEAALLSARDVRPLVHGDQRLVTFDSTGVALWTPDDGYRTGATLAGAKNGQALASFAVSADESKIAAIAWTDSLDSKANLLIWDASSTKLVSTTELSHVSYQQIEFMPDGNSVVISNDSTIERWSLGANVTRLQALQTQWAAINALRVSPNGRLLAVSDLNAGLFVIDISGEKAWGVDNPVIDSFRVTDDDYTREADWLPDSKRVLLSTRWNTRILDTTTRKTTSFPGLVAGISKDGRLLATAGSDPSSPVIRVFNVSTGEEIQSLSRAHRATVADLTWAPNGRLFSTDTSGIVRLWNAQAANLIIRP